MAPTSAASVAPLPERREPGLASGPSGPLAADQNLSGGEGNGPLAPFSLRGTSTEAPSSQGLRPSDLGMAKDRVVSNKTLETPGQSASLGQEVPGDSERGGARGIPEIPSGGPSTSATGPLRGGAFAPGTEPFSRTPYDSGSPSLDEVPLPPSVLPAGIEGPLEAPGSRRLAGENPRPGSPSAPGTSPEEALFPLRERSPRDRREGSEGESRRQAPSFSGDPAALAAGGVAPARSAFGDVLAAQNLGARGSAAILEGAELLLRAAVRAESHSARMIIDPPALGPVEVSVTLAADGLSASFRVESETVRQLLLQHADALRESLARAGLPVGGFSLSVDVGPGDRRPPEPSPEGRRRARDRRSAGGGAGPQEPWARLDAQEGVLHWVG